MAGLNDAETWAAEVYQIETTDPVQGGAPNPTTGAGMTNIPHLQLANRTRWLKQRVDTLVDAVVPATSGTAGISRLATQAEAEGGTNDVGVLTSLRTRQAIDARTAGRLVPTGAVIFLASNAAPTGYLKANGAAVSRTTYAALFAAIGTTFGAGDGSTTFNLPDMRGMFPRGWDDGRGVDTGRALGSFQDSANQSHLHTGTVDSSGSHTHGASTGVAGSHYHETSGTPNGSNGNAEVNPDQYGGGNSSQPDGSQVRYTSYAGDHQHSVTINSGGAHVHTFTTAAQGEGEARPKNIALLAVIKF